MGQFAVQRSGYSCVGRPAQTGKRSWLWLRSKAGTVRASDHQVADIKTCLMKSRLQGPALGASWRSRCFDRRSVRGKGFGPTTIACSRIQLRRTIAPNRHFEARM